MKTTFLFSFLLLAYLMAYAQKIENVTAAQQGKNIMVSYDLMGTPGIYDVSLWCSTDGGLTFDYPLNSVSGDVGSSITIGSNKQIEWNVLADRDKLVGNRILFEVRAKSNNENFIDLGIEMVFVKGGTFTMGSEFGDNDEKPTHQVTVSDFYIGKYKVTQKQWSAVMSRRPDELHFVGCNDCPVESVSWNDVQEFIKKLNQKTSKTYLLPTEAEWEYAARGGASTNSATTYAGSNNIDDVAWYRNNSGSKTHPVGQKKPNALGIYDMSGNVWEWCSDWYGSYSSGSRTNPQGPSSGSYRVRRGGSWDYGPPFCRGANRDNSEQGRRYSVNGFRLVWKP